MFTLQSIHNTHDNKVLEQFDAAISIYYSKNGKKNGSTHVPRLLKPKIIETQEELDFWILVSSNFQLFVIIVLITKHNYYILCRINWWWMCNQYAL